MNEELKALFARLLAGTALMAQNTTPAHKLITDQMGEDIAHIYMTVFSSVPDDDVFEEMNRQILLFGERFDELPKPEEKRILTLVR